MGMPSPATGEDRRQGWVPFFAPASPWLLVLDDCCCGSISGQVALLNYNLTGQLTIAKFIPAWGFLGLLPLLESAFGGVGASGHRGHRAFAVPLGCLALAHGVFRLRPWSEF